MAQDKVKRSPSQIKYELIQSTIKLWVVLLFLGLIFIFILMPTYTFKHTWNPQFQAKTNSTYFGAQGHFLIQLCISFHFFVCFNSFIC